MSRKESSENKPWIVIIVAVLALIGVVIGAIIQYMAAKAPVELSISATQTAETKLTLVASSATSPVPPATMADISTNTLTNIPAPPTNISTESPTSSPTHTPVTSAVMLPTPTNTPKPDAVVNVEALNLRSGPDVVYDIVGVLKRGDCLKINCKCPKSRWLGVTCTDSGQEGWVNASLLEINLPLAGVPVGQVPPTPTPEYTPTPTVTSTPVLLPAPILLGPDNGAAFLGEPVVLKWQWDRPRTPDEVFSVRVHREGETRLCHHAQARDLEYKGSLSYCTAGTHYWGVALARRLCGDETDERCWQTLSEPSAERWFYYVPGDEPWTWPPTPTSSGGGGESGGGIGESPRPP